MGGLEERVKSQGGHTKSNPWRPRTSKPLTNKGKKQFHKVHHYFFYPVSFLFLNNLFNRFRQLYKTEGTTLRLLARQFHLRRHY